jgi:hypothetical protein
VLIVNADDWGRSSGETEAALACFLQGRVTSVSAMTFMPDSERAARMALEHRVPVGLHLNFTQPFTEGRVDNSVLREHRRVVRFLALLPRPVPELSPLFLRSFRLLFRVQLEEFTRLYSKAPTHFDGHHHMHLCLSMLLAEPIPRGQKLRRSFSFAAGEKSVANRFYRRALHRWVQGRYRTTDYFFALSQRMAEQEFTRVADLARSTNVELMTHPAVPAERSFLLDGEFERKVAGVIRGSYADL